MGCSSSGNSCIFNDKTLRVFGHPRRNGPRTLANQRERERAGWLAANELTANMIRRLRTYYSVFGVVVP